MHGKGTNFDCVEHDYYCRPKRRIDISEKEFIIRIPSFSDGNARSLMAVNGLSQHAALFLFDDGSEYDEVRLRASSNLNPVHRNKIVI